MHIDLTGVLRRGLTMSANSLVQILPIATAFDGSHQYVLRRAHRREIEKYASAFQATGDALDKKEQWQFDKDVPLDDDVSAAEVLGRPVEFATNELVVAVPASSGIRSVSSTCR